MRVQARSRRGRRAGLSLRVGQSFAGPGEIKRREASWTLTKSWTIICGSGRDPEEGGEMDSQEEVKLSFTGPGEMKSREVMLDPQQSPERSKAGR